MTDDASIASGAVGATMLDTTACTKKTGMPAMNDATTAGQNLDRERARARRVETGRSIMRPPRTVMASVRDSIEPTMIPTKARIPSPTSRRSLLEANPFSKSTTPRSISTTSSPHDARASGPTVPRMISPM